MRPLLLGALAALVAFFLESWLLSHGLSSFWILVAAAPLVEELLKGACLLPGPRSATAGAWIGLAFGIVEAALFVAESLVFGGFGAMLALRLLVTIPLHMATAALQGTGASRGSGWWTLALAAAIALHAAYNLAVGTFS